jgi:hypothetical protein
MSFTVTLPDKCVFYCLKWRAQVLINIHSYPYVGAALVSTVWLLIVQGVIVSRYRKRAGVKYPQSAFYISLLLWQRWSTHSVCWKGWGRSVQGCTEVQLRSALVRITHFMLSTVVNLSHYRRSPEHPREHTTGACLVCLHYYFQKHRWTWFL